VDQVKFDLTPGGSGGGGGGGGDSGCPASTVFTLLGSTDRADQPGTKPGWFELAEITLFNEAGENVAAQATYELLIEPSNADAIGVRVHISREVCVQVCVQVCEKTGSVCRSSPTARSSTGALAALSSGRFARI
jgi:hypothetical protein